jgi:phosphatidylglycerophosphatase A
VNLSKPLATMFGVGRVPLMPGTAASAVALPFAWLIAAAFGAVPLLLLAVAVALLAVPISWAYARQTGREDPSDCVIDELAGQWLACACAPLTLWGFALAFVLFRLFDMTKLWPVSAAEKLKGGWGIVADDVVAGAMAGVIVLLAVHFGLL